MKAGNVNGQAADEDEDLDYVPKGKGKRAKGGGQGNGKHHGEAENPRGAGQKGRPSAGPSGGKKTPLIYHNCGGRGHPMRLCPSAPETADMEVGKCSQDADDALSDGSSACGVDWENDELCAVVQPKGKAGTQHEDI